jgi:hypothetical protein
MEQDVPVQSVHLEPFTLLFIRPNVPLFLQLLEVMMNVLFKLTNALCRKGMRDCLPLARMFGPIPCVEQATSDTHKRIIVLALEEAVAMPIDLRDGIGVGNANMVGLNAHELPVFGVRVMNSEVALAATTLSEKPEVCKGSGEGRGDGADLPVADIRKQVV